jgi:hypothetical protein
MKSILALAVALALSATGMASAGMQGQGAKPTAKVPEYKEPNPGPYGYRLMEMDENADTYITRDEAKVNRPLMEHFNKLDKNNDNKLDKSELAAF